MAVDVLQDVITFGRMGDRRHKKQEDRPHEADSSWGRCDGHPHPDRDGEKARTGDKGS